MPTLIDLCGFDTDTSDMDGKSLMPIILNENAPSNHKAGYCWEFKWRNGLTWVARKGNGNCIQILLIPAAVIILIQKILYSLIWKATLGNPTIYTIESQRLSLNSKIYTKNGKVSSKKEFIIRNLIDSISASGQCAAFPASPIGESELPQMVYPKYRRWMSPIRLRWLDLPAPACSGLQKKISKIRRQSFPGQPF